MFGFSLWARLAIAVAIAVFVAGVIYKIRHSGVVAGRAEVQAAWNAETVEEKRQQAAAREKADAATRDLQASADTNRRKANAEILALNVRVSEYAARLRSRPERPDVGSVPTVAGTRPSGCTPSELYRSDASLALQIAADADRLRIGLQACQAAYNAARAVTP
jgi:hypothetical protein